MYPTRTTPRIGSKKKKSIPSAKKSGFVCNCRNIMYTKRNHDLKQPIHLAGAAWPATLKSQIPSKEDEMHMWRFLPLLSCPSSIRLHPSHSPPHAQSLALKSPNAEINEPPSSKKSKRDKEERTEERKKTKYCFVGEMMEWRSFLSVRCCCFADGHGDGLFMEFVRAMRRELHGQLGYKRVGVLL